MNRRGFFSSLGVLLGTAAVAPSIFIPKLEPVVWKVQRIRKLKMFWNAELEQDLKAYYNINAETEITSLITESLKVQCPEISIQTVSIKEGLVYEPCNFTPKQTAIITLNTPISTIPNGYYSV